MEAQVLNKCIFLCFTGEKHDPSYYSLKSRNTTACLATDFSAHNATTHLELFNKTEATRMNGDSYYSQVALGGENCTEGTFQMMPNHSICMCSVCMCTHCEHNLCRLRWQLQMLPLTILYDILNHLFSLFASRWFREMWSKLVFWHRYISEHLLSHLWYDQTSQKNITLFGTCFL